MMSTHDFNPLVLKYILLLSQNTKLKFITLTIHKWRLPKLNLIVEQSKDYF